MRHKITAVSCKTCTVATSISILALERLQPKVSPSFLGSQSVPAGTRQAFRIPLRIPLLLTNRPSFRPDTQLLFMQNNGESANATPRSH